MLIDVMPSDQKHFRLVWTSRPCIAAVLIGCLCSQGKMTQYQSLSRDLHEDWRVEHAKPVDIMTECTTELMSAIFKTSKKFFQASTYIRRLQDAVLSSFLFYTCSFSMIVCYECTLTKYSDNVVLRFLNTNIFTYSSLQYDMNQLENWSSIYSQKMSNIVFEGFFVSFW